MSNNSITININNWKWHATDGEGEALLDSYEIGRDGSRDPPKPEWLTMLDKLGVQFEWIKAGSSLPTSPNTTARPRRLSISSSPI